MGKRILTIKEIQEALLEITSGTKKLIKATENIPSSIFKQDLINYISAYALVNQQLSLYLLKEIPKQWSSDKIDSEFDKIIKDIKKDLEDNE